MRYADHPVDPFVAARELNVQVMVEGSIQKFGTRLRVHVQAWDAENGSTIVSIKHDSDTTDLFSLQDTIAETLVRALGVSAPGVQQEPAEPPTKNPRAYELFLRAVERLSRLNRWDTRTAIDMLESAIELDPKFSEAWGRLAEGCLLMEITFEPGAKWASRAERAVRRALTLNPRDAAAHCTRGRLLWSPARGFKNRSALRALEKAIAINPGSHKALVWKGNLLFHVGLMDQALVTLRAGLAAEPDDPETLFMVGHMAGYQWDYDEAEEFHARALSVDPSHFWATIFYPMIPLYRGQLERAEEKVAAARYMAPRDPLVDSSEALLWAKRGEARKAQQVARRVLRDTRTLTYSHHALHMLAATYAVLGKPAEAVKFLRRATGVGFPCYPVFRDDPHFKSLHALPEFVRFLDELKRGWTSYEREFGRA